jgi:hypothetical protein
MNLAAQFLISRLFLACFLSAAYSNGNDKVCHQKLEEMTRQTFISEDKGVNWPNELQLFVSTKVIKKGAYGSVSI